MGLDIDGQRGNLMRSLAVKLVLGFTLVSLVGIGLVALMTARLTGNQFRELITDQVREALFADLVDFYRQNGTWQGVERLAANPDFSQRYDWGFVVVDTQGVVILSSSVVDQYPRIFERNLQVGEGIPIQVDGNRVGMYFNLDLRDGRHPPLRRHWNESPS